MKRWILFILSLFLCFAAVGILNHRIGIIPPLASTLSPFEGLWANAEFNWPWSRHHRMVIQNHALHDPVTIEYDRSHVPHIFAKSDADAYFAQGWVTAHDRLWQMDFQARVGLGRLSAVVGPMGISRDRFFLRMRFPEAALKSLEKVKQDPESWKALQAYTAGVNSYIESLKPWQYPFEFKLIGYAPTKWTPLKTMIVAKLITFQLTTMNSDLQMTRSLALHNEKVMDDLFPYFPYNNLPIIRDPMHFDEQPIKIAKPSTTFIPQREDLNLENLTRYFPKTSAGYGSNSWAVMGSRTASGYPILANDTHLNYSLPGMWYQIQFKTPDMNVYGVSIPGVPAVMIGFTPTVAWGATNGYADVLDWYDIHFKNDKEDEYWYNNQWVPTQKSTALIKVRGQAPVEETIVSTQQGPVVYEKGMTPLLQNQPTGMAMRWIGQEPSDDLVTFIKLNHAKTYHDCEDALKYFTAPAQNFTCVDSAGTVALWHDGKLPLKWKGQGRYIADGSDPTYDWHGWIAHDQLPHVINPTEGYVLSANQHPTDSSYPYYLGWDYPDSYRATRIDELLKSNQHVTVNDFEKMQFDEYSTMAAQALPALLKVIEKNKISPDDQRWVDVLAKWDLKYTADSVAATIFDVWWSTFYRDLWEPQFGKSTYFAWPPVSRTVELMVKEPNSNWFTHAAHAKNFAELATESFTSAIQSLESQKLDDWQWGHHIVNTLPHIARIPGLDAHFSMGGNKYAINANSGVHGPCWRMIVEMGPHVHAKVIMPGGQSGNPGSKWYNDETQDWENGRFRDAVFLNQPDLKDKRLSSVIELEKL